MSDRTAYLRAAAQMCSNAGQWAAFEASEHCVVLAGPGSGKTKTLTAKMARILAEEVHAPRGVACITFNNECARELEDRLARLGIIQDRRVFIGTVHSFSLTQIILPYALSADMGLPTDFTIAGRADRQAALVDAVGKPEIPRGLESRLASYRRTYLNREAPSWYTDLGLVGLIERYEAALRRRGCIDYDDMPLLAVRALRNHPWLKRALSAKFPVLFVDEYQDLGLALHRMVMDLCFSAGMRLFAVGDVDQSIYGFTGARPDLLQTLSERDDVQTVHLRLNYRSGTQIVAAASVALANARDYEAADAAAQGAVFIEGRGGSYAQQAAVALRDLLPQALARHPEFNLCDVAVLYPAAWIGDAVATAAVAAGIAFVRTDTNALYPRSSRIMQWIESCAQWCCGGWRSGVPRFSHILKQGERLLCASLNTEQQRLAFQHSLIDMLWARRDARMAVHDWLNPLLGQVIEPFRDRSAALRDELIILAAFAMRVAPEGSHSAMLLNELAGDGAELNRLTLSTLHSAKGREFGIVLMFGMDEGRLPRHGANRDEQVEARRLFYVGMTRAKREIHLLHTAGAASPFVTEIAVHLFEQ